MLSFSFLFPLTLLSFFYQQQEMCCSIFCFESALNLTLYSQQLRPRKKNNKGLFFLIAKIVMSGNESVKMCLHKITVARSVLNEMHNTGKNPVLSKEVN